MPLLAALFVSETAKFILGVPVSGPVGAVLRRYANRGQRANELMNLAGGTFYTG